MQATDTPGKGSGRWLWLRLPLLLVILTVVAHSWELTGPYAYDDQLYIQLNPAVQKGLGDWPRFFTDPSTYSIAKTVHYRPFVALSYALNVSMGWGIFGFKLTQLVLHVLAVLALYWMLAVPVRRFVTAPPMLPFSAAAFMGIMPFNVEAVHYLTARSAVLCGLFSILSVGLYLAMRGERDPRRMAPLYVAHMLALVTALLAKETAVVVPAVLLVADLLFVRQAMSMRCFSWRFLWPYIPYAAGVGVVLVAMPNFNTISYHLAKLTGDPWRLPTAIYCLVENVRLMLVPVGLTIAHPIDETARWASMRTVGSLAVVVALLAWAFRVRRQLPLVSFGVAWYFLFISPSTFVHLTTVLMENRGYTASAGVSMAVGVLLCHAWQTFSTHRKQMTAAAVIALLCLVGFGYDRQSDWKTTEALWKNAVQYDPSSSDAWINLGTSYVRSQKMEQGAEVFAHVMKTFPDRPEAPHNLARIYVLQKQYKKAVILLERLVALRPNDPNHLEQLVHAYAGLGRLEDAFSVAGRLLAVDLAGLQGTLHVYTNGPEAAITVYVTTALKVGRTEEALAAIMKWREINRSNPPQLEFLEMQVYLASGKLDQAEAILNRLLALFPDNERIGVWKKEIALRRAQAGTPG